MSRHSFRPLPLDIYKKLPIVKSIKDFEDDNGVPAAASTRTLTCFTLLRWTLRFESILFKLVFSITKLEKEQEP